MTTEIDYSKLEDLTIENLTAKHYISDSEYDSSDKFEKTLFQKFESIKEINHNLDETFVNSTINLFNEFELIRILHNYWFDVFEYVTDIQINIYKHNYKNPIEDITNAIEADIIIINHVVFECDNISFAMYLNVENNLAFIRSDNIYTIICKYSEINIMYQTISDYIINNTKEITKRLMWKYQNLDSKNKIIKVVSDWNWLEKFTISNMSN